MTAISGSYSVMWRNLVQQAVAAFLPLLQQRFDLLLQLFDPCFTLTEGLALFSQGRVELLNQVVLKAKAGLQVNEGLLVVIAHMC